MAREKYQTTDQAIYWLEKIDTTCLNDELSKYLHEDVVHFIERMPYFFFSTCSSKGNSNVNFKGTDGRRLIKVINNKKLLFPDFRGNGILHSTGDMYSNPNVGILIIDFTKNIRLKISGKATIIDDRSSIENYIDYFESYDIQRLIEIEINYVIPNCSKNIDIVQKMISQ